MNYVLVDVRVPSKYYKPDNWTRREHKRVLFTFLRFYYYYYYYIIRLWLVLGIAVPAAAIIFLRISLASVLIIWVLIHRLFLWGLVIFPPPNSLRWGCISVSLVKTESR